MEDPIAANKKAVYEPHEGRFRVTLDVDWLIEEAGNLINDH